MDVQEELAVEELDQEVVLEEMALRILAVVEEEAVETLEQVDLVAQESL